MALLGDIVPKELHTERLTLELFAGTDEQFDGFLEWVNSPQSLALQGDFGMKSRVDKLRFTAAFRLRGSRFKDGLAERDLVYYLRLKSENKLIGCVSLAQREAGSRLLPPDIGWLLAQPYFGKGYAAEAAREFLRFLREGLGFNDISCLVNERNAPSNKLAAKLGFKGGNTIWVEDEQEYSPLWVLPHMGQLGITEPVNFKGEVERWERQHPQELEALRKSV